MSSPDHIVAFLAAMEAAGMKPVEPIAARLVSGDLFRFQCEGDRAGRKNGWAVLHLDGVPAGSFGHFASGISGTWRADSKRLSSSERADLLREAEASRRQREKEKLAIQETVAKESERIWGCAGPADPSHPYLARKRVLGEGLRQDGHFLLVPMHDDDGKIWNIQRISPTGVKRFAKGGRQKGLYFFIGEPTDTILIAEGFSTAASVRRATGFMSVVAFSSGNLKETAVAIDKRFPAAQIIICADDDAHLVANRHIKKNAGIEAAGEAAEAVWGYVAVPPRRLSHG